MGWGEQLASDCGSGVYEGEEQNCGPSPAGVVGSNLARNNLSGPIPVELGLLTALAKL